MRLWVASWVSTAALLIVIGTAARAASDVTRAGPIESRPTQCFIAKFNPHLGRSCEPPPLVEGTPQSRAASHGRRGLFFIEIHDAGAARREIDRGLEADPQNFELRLLSARLMWWTAPAPGTEVP